MRGFAGFGTTLVMIPIFILFMPPVEAVLIGLTIDVIAMVPMFPSAAKNSDWKRIMPIFIGSVAAATLPMNIGIIRFQSEFLAALGNIGTMAITSIVSPIKTASTGGMNKINIGIITKVVPNPAKPLIKPPKAVIAIRLTQSIKVKCSPRPRTAFYFN